MQGAGKISKFASQSLPVLGFCVPKPAAAAAGLTDAIIHPLPLLTLRWQPWRLQVSLPVSILTCE
jgi:hypothetical protein